MTRIKKGITCNTDSQQQIIPNMYLNLTTELQNTWSKNKPLKYIILTNPHNHPAEVGAAVPILQISKFNLSVVSDSVRPRGLQPTRLLCLWDSSGKNIGVGCHVLLQGIFLTQGLNRCLLHLLHGQADSLPLSHLWSPKLKLRKVK